MTRKFFKTGLVSRQKSNLRLIALVLTGILLIFLGQIFPQNITPVFAELDGGQTGGGYLDGEQTGGFDSGGLDGEQTGEFGSSCRVERLYPECDPTGPGWVHEVWRGSDCNLFIPPQSVQFQGGVCGDTLAPAPQPTPSPVCQEITRSYPQCGGTVGLLDFPKTDTIWVTEITNTCTGAKDYWRIPPLNLGNRGECFVAPTPTPVVVFPTPTPVSPPVCIQVITNARNPFTGECRAFPTPCDVPSGWQVVASCFVPTPTPTVPVVTPVPPQGGVSQSCPNGTTFGGINGSNLICVQQVQNQVQNAIANANASTGPITVTVAGSTSPQIIERAVVINPAPVVVKTVVAGDMVELPKTGLPIAAWALTGLAPLGFRLRRFGYSLKKSTRVAQYLWQQREFDKE